MAPLSSPLAAVDMRGEAGRGADSIRAPTAHNRAGLDRSELRARVDESQALLDGLARETLSLGKAEHDELYQSLRKEYNIEKFAGKGRKALEEAEQVLELQNAIKGQQALLKSLPPTGTEKEESKLLGQQSDLVGAVEDLRNTLMDVHKNATEDEARDFGNWIMVSEGLLRGRREDRAAPSTSSGQALSETGEALNAESISPTGGTEAEPLTKAAKP